MTKITQILIVDDNDLLRQDLVDLFGLMGHRSVGAADGCSGLQLAKEIQPDLIILDVMMPDMDGLSVLQTLRTDPATTNTPVLLLTGMDQNQIPESSPELGEIHYVQKPFVIKDLLATIDLYLCASP